MVKIKLYNNGGIQEYEPAALQKMITEHSLVITPAKIVSARILERKFLSNRGNALDGVLEMSHGFQIGLNIGGNPIGTGYKNYIQFLDEIGCAQSLGLYRIPSIIGLPIAVLFHSNTSRGYLTPKGIEHLAKSIEIAD